MIIDSHCHLDQLDLTEHDDQLDNVLIAGKNNGVGAYLCVCLNLDNFSAVLDIAKQYPNVFASVGVHPNYDDVYDPSVDELVKLASQDLIVAIGETGLDYHYNSGDLTWQHNRFANHLEAAVNSNKPLIIHMRDAADDALRLMREKQADQVGGVMHCFTDTWETAQAAMDLNFYISFSGIVTFKNAKALQAVAKKVPLDRMLIETDSPYLAPTPFRGKPNQPAYVKYVAQCIAELRNEPVETIAKHTTDNFFKLFKIDRSILKGD